MSEITRYLLLDADGADASEETERFDDVERWAQAASAPVAIVARVYEYTHTEMVRWPQGETEWPPSEAAQEASGQYWSRDADEAREDEAPARG
jgi:hypothetical protein